jgi:hypothetical protein
MPKEKNTCVYVVKQFQPQENYNGDIIYTYTKEEDAVKAARNLNKTYGDNCIFDMNGDYEETLNEENCHFYLVEACVVDTYIPEEEKYYEFFVIKAGWNFVGENDTIVEDVDKAMKFNTWDEARSMIKVLESLDVCDRLPLYVKGINHKY